MAIINMNESNFREMINGQVPVLAEFKAPWCTYCRRIAPALKKVAEEFDGQLIVGEVDIDVSPALAEEYQIELVPTLIVFKNGQLLGDVVNPASKAQIEELVRKHLNI